MTPIAHDPGVTFVACELGKWEAQVARPQPALALAFFCDERPLRGAAGLADWRLCGRLSRLLKAGRMSGRCGETLMTPPGSRLPFARLVLFGLGESRRFGEARYREEVRRIRRVLARAGLARYVVQPPGRSSGLIAPRRALELWLDEAEVDGLAADVTFIESPSGQKEMAEALWR